MPWIRTTDPDDLDTVREADLEALRAARFSDLDIVDANNQCAPLNDVTRVANGPGLRHEVGVDVAAFAAIPA